MGWCCYLVRIARAELVAIYYCRAELINIAKLFYYFSAIFFFFLINFIDLQAIFRSDLLFYALHQALLLLGCCVCYFKLLLFIIWSCYLACWFQVAGFLVLLIFFAAELLVFGSPFFRALALLFIPQRTFQFPGPAPRDQLPLELLQLASMVLPSARSFYRLSGILLFSFIAAAAAALPDLLSGCCVSYLVDCRQQQQHQTRTNCVNQLPAMSYLAIFELS